jgi:hypothetical protein
MHSLQVLGKGVFRAALLANNRFGEEMPIYIVPVGIEYGDYFRYRSTSLVTYGKPINITEFVKSLNVENEAQMMEPLKKELKTRMAGLMTYIESDDNFDRKWALTKILAREDARQGCLKDRMLHNRHVIEQIEKACEAKPEDMEKLLDDALTFEKNRRKNRLSIWSFGSRNKISNVIGKSFIALLGIPYFLFAATVTLPMWLTFEILRGKLKDRAFHNTAGFGIKLGMGLVYYPAMIIVAFCLTSWPVALLLTLLSIPAYGFFYDYTEFIRTYISDIRLHGNRKMSDSFNRICTTFSKI